MDTHNIGFWVVVTLIVLATFTTAVTTKLEGHACSAMREDIRVNELGSILASSWRSVLILNRRHRVTISQRLLGATDTLPDVETDQP